MEFITRDLLNLDVLFLEIITLEPNLVTLVYVYLEQITLYRLNVQFML